MIYQKFRISTSWYITDAYCECGELLVEVSDSLLSSAMFCTVCENVYKLDLRKVPSKKLGKSFIERCRKEAGKAKQ